LIAVVWYMQDKGWYILKIFLSSLGEDHMVENRDIAA